jgi:hypothetical protein
MIKFRFYLKYLHFGIVLGVFLTTFTEVIKQPLVLAMFLAPAPESTSSAKPTMSPGPDQLTATPTPAIILTLTHTVTPLPTDEPQPILYAHEPTEFPEEINPLTGLPAQEPELLKRRPMAIKVTNYPRSVRPQWGLSLADHVYEYYIGDHMSRFIGVFYGQDAERVGPVRSARLFDEHVMRMYKAIFVFGWADDPILEFLLTDDLQRYLLVERPGNCPPMCRFGPEYKYNTLFADTSQIEPYLEAKGIANRRKNQDGLRFELQIPKSGHPGEQLSIQYSTVSYHRWDYEAMTGKYLRYQDFQDDGLEGKNYSPLRDSLTGEQLAADNIVVLRVPHEYFYQSTSTEIIDQPIIGQGKGYALRDGFLFPILWNHETRDALFEITLPDGRMYPLKPGQTWFEIIGVSSTFETTTAGSWNIEFSMP